MTGFDRDAARAVMDDLMNGDWEEDPEEVLDRLAACYRPDYAPQLREVEAGRVAVAKLAAIAALCDDREQRAASVGRAVIGRSANAYLTTAEVRAVLRGETP